MDYLTIYNSARVHMRTWQEFLLNSVGVQEIGQMVGENGEIAQIAEAVNAVQRGKIRIAYCMRQFKK